MDEPNNAPSGRAPPSRRPEGLIIRAAEPSDAGGAAALTNLLGFRAGTLQMPFRSSPPLVPGSSGTSRGGCTSWPCWTAESSDRRRSPGFPAGAATRRASAWGCTTTTWTGGSARRCSARCWTSPTNGWVGRLKLTVHADNVPAIRLYERAGFGREGLHRRFALRDGALHDALRGCGREPLRRPPGAAVRRAAPPA